MNHPEHRDVIVFDDNIFEEGEIVEVTLKSKVEPIRGRLTYIDNLGFNIDVSRQFHSDYEPVQYSDVIAMNMVSE
jgi:hypothetical protein